MKITLKLLTFFIAQAFAYQAGAAISCKAIHMTAPSAKLSAATQRTVDRYFEDTLSGLEAMRGENGLLSDAIWVKNNKNGTHSIETLNSATSPTNMAVDILIQAELWRDPKTQRAAAAKLNRVINTLSRLEFHKDTGLLFSRYTSDTKVPQIKDSCVSSIDNVHLAMALWTLREINPHSNIGKKAGELFDRMDFSVYYDAKSGLIGGNLREVGGRWEKESYNFANLGSEARVLYSAGWALGLFKNIKNDRAYLQKAFTQLKMEIYKSPEGELLKLWDGSAFQLFFPRIFANENLYSPVLDKMFVNKGRFMVAEGRRRHISTPAAHTATRVGTHEDHFKGEGTIYRDKGGILKLVSSDNHDVADPTLNKLWEGAFAPHALVMAATAAPEGLINRLGRLEKTKSGEDALYKEGLGWMEGVHVSGSQRGEVVSSQLSLNQGMLALSLQQIKDPMGLSASARAMYNNPAVRKRLETFYKFFDKKSELVSSEAQTN